MCPEPSKKVFLQANSLMSNAGLPSATDDRLYAYEAGGTLLGGEELGTEEQRVAVANLLDPLVHQMHANLPDAAGSGMNYGP